MKINEELKLKYPWKVEWTDRAREAAKFIPSYAGVIDLGGGLGELYKALKDPMDYYSIDLERWNDHTIKADFNKGEFPCHGSMVVQFVTCLGTLEYIENPKSFLSEIRKYADRLVISYRKSSSGGMERKNDLTFEMLENLLQRAGWEVLAKRRVKHGDRIYFCNKVNEKD
jgi:hypothetical protein